MEKIIAALTFLFLLHLTSSTLPYFDEERDSFVIEAEENNEEGQEDEQANEFISERRKRQWLNIHLPQEQNYNVEYLNGPGILMFPSLVQIPVQVQGHPGRRPVKPSKAPPTESPETETEWDAETETRSEEGACWTNSGLLGKCTTLRNCYPILYSSFENERFRNEELAYIVRNESGICTQENFPKLDLFSLNGENVMEDIICCPNDLSTAKSNKNAAFFKKRPNNQMMNVQKRPNIIKSSCTSQYIVGGSETWPSKYPFMAALLNNGKQFCDGSLITNQHVLTAAHCVAPLSSSTVGNVKVRLGAHNVYASAVDRKVAKVFYNKNYNARTFHNDVAILKLNSPVQFDTKVKPICIDQPSIRLENQKATVAGWGTTQSGKPGGPHKLREVSIPIWSNGQCGKRYGNLAPGGITNAMICAGSRGTDACSGDSGGPLFLNDGTTRQIGIVSWGIGCGDFPGVYTRLSVVLPWVKKNLI